MIAPSTLTDRGRDLLEANRYERDERSHEPRQTFYAGLRKPRELTHDTKVYRAYQRAEERLRGQGGRVRRVVLDYELKRDYQRFLHERNRGKKDCDGRPDREPEEIARWAREHELPYDDGHVRFPDARIEYEDRDGRSRHEDLEVVTGHYRGAHAGSRRQVRIHLLSVDRLLGRRSRRRRTADGAPADYRGVDPMTLPPAPDRWTIELANAERMEAIAAFGFTERQARFLLNVLLHSGVFVERQYCSFAGIVHGQKSTDFIKTLVERRFATPITTGKLHRGRMFHVHYKPLWAAIGEPDNRFRKPTAQGRMIERVMLLDAVLDDREFIWLGPSMDKRRHFIRHLGGAVGASGVSAPDCSVNGPDKTVRYFPDKLPIGMQPYARHPRLRLPRDASRRRWTSGCSCCGTCRCSGCCSDGRSGCCFRVSS